MKRDDTLALRISGVYVTVEKRSNGTFWACDKNSLDEDRCYPFDDSVCDTTQLFEGQKLVVDISHEDKIVSMYDAPKPIDLSILKCFTIQVNPFYDALCFSAVGIKKLKTGLCVQFLLSADTACLQPPLDENTNPIQSLLDKRFGFTANVWVEPSALKEDTVEQYISVPIRYLSVNYR
jgi:hypothetical protein